MKVALIYFKQGGRYYSEAEYESASDKPWEIYAEVRGFAERRRLPGLVDNHGAYHVYVDIPDGVPALIIVDES